MLERLTTTEVPVWLGESIAEAIGTLPLDRYGFGEWVHKGMEFPNNGSSTQQYPIIVKPYLPDMSAYDCVDAACFVQDRIMDRFGDDVKPVLYNGSDEAGLFDFHVFNVVSEADRTFVVDPSPMYPLIGAKHTPEEKYMRKNSRAYYPNETLTISLVADRSQYTFSTIHVSIPLMRERRSVEFEPTMHETNDLAITYATHTRGSRDKNIQTTSFYIDVERFEECPEVPQRGWEYMEFAQRENIVWDIQTARWDDQTTEYLERKETDTGEFERIRDMEIFQKDKDHIGNYVRKILSFYRMIP